MAATINELVDPPEEEDDLTAELYEEYLDLPNPPEYNEPNPSLLNGQRYHSDLHYKSIKKEYIENINSKLKQIRTLKTATNFAFTEENFKTVLANKKGIEEYINAIVKIISNSSSELYDIFEYLYDRSEFLLQKYKAQIAALEQALAASQAKLQQAADEMAALTNQLQEERGRSSADLSTRDQEIKDKIDALNARLKALLQIGPANVTGEAVEIGAIEQRPRGRSGRRTRNGNELGGGTRIRKKYRH